MHRIPTDHTPTQISPQLIELPLNILTESPSELSLTILANRESSIIHGCPIENPPNWKSPELSEALLKTLPTSTPRSSLTHGSPTGNRPN